MSTDQNEIESLIARSLSGETSAQDEQRIAEWISAAPENKSEFLRLKRVYELSGKLTSESYPEINMDQEWNRFASAIRQLPVKALEPAASPVRMWLRIAAAVILVVAGGVMVSHILSGSTMRFQTADQTLTLSLPDGSHVVLNRHSELSYSSRFGSSNRSVNLTGEAFFDVAHDASHPFVIHSGDAEVEVLGTSFNVRAYEQERTLEVTVETGLVRLATSSHDQEVKLHPGEKGLFAKSSHQISQRKNDDPNFQSWKTRKIILTETDLRTAVDILNKTYGARIRITMPVPPTCVVTASFEGQSLEAVLHVLKATLNLTYQGQGDTVEIIHAGC